MSALDTIYWEEVLKDRHPEEAQAAPKLVQTAARMLAVASMSYRKQALQKVCSAPQPPQTAIPTRIKRAFRVLAGKE